MSPPCCHPRATPLASPRRTFCDKCRGRAAWLSYPPAAAPPGRSRTRRRPWSARRLRGEGSGETVAPRSGRGGGVRPTTGFPPSWVLPELQKTTSVSPALAGQDISPGRVTPARRGEQHGDRDTSQKVPRGKQQGQGTEGELWMAAGAQPSWQARSPSLPERPSCPPRALTVVGEARFAQTHDKVHFHLVRSHGFGANGALETWRESREKSPQPGEKEEEEEERSPPRVPGSPPGVPRALTRRLHGGTCPTPCPLALRSSCVVATSSGSVGTATRAGAPGGAEGAGHTWPPAAARL